MDEVQPGQGGGFLPGGKSDWPSRKNPIAVEEFEFKVRRIITDYLTPPKNEYKLKRVLWWMERFRSELEEMVYVSDEHDLFKTYEVDNIIQCATMSATASLNGPKAAGCHGTSGLISRKRTKPNGTSTLC